MKYFVILFILIGLSGTAFAMHDPNDPNPHPTMPQIQMQNDTNTIKQFHSQYDKIEFIDGNPFFVSEKYDANPVSNETITFHGVNFTHPSYPEIQNPGGFVSTAVTFEDSIKKSVSVGFTPNPIPVLTEHKGVFAGMMRDSDGLHFLVSADLIKISPLKQFKSGITIDQIQCKEGFVVVIKKSNGIPSCVTHETLEKLRERGWTEPLGDIVFQRPSQTKPEPTPGPEPLPEPAPMSESETKQKQQQAKLHTQEVIMTDYRGHEHQINTINEYRAEFEPGYFLEQFIFSNKPNYEKDDLINFIFVEWGYQPQKCTSPKVEVYLRPYDNYDKIEKISEWQKPEEECISLDSDSSGYLIMNSWTMPGIFEPHQTCTIPGEYRVVASNLKDGSKKEFGYYTCQKEKLIGLPQPWMELPE